MPPRRQFKPVNRKPGDDWVRIANNGDAADIYILDEIGLWGTTAEAFVEQLNGITASQIRLHISSPGGSVFDALTIHSALTHHPATVTTYVDGLAASAASFIALAGDRIVTARNAMWMIHDAATFTWGNATDLRKEAELLDQVSDNIADIYAQQAGGNVADWRDLMRAETWYTGAEAVEAGLADDLLAGKRKRDTGQGTDDDTEDMSRWDLAARFRYAGRDAAPDPKAIGRERITVKVGNDTTDGLLAFLRQQVRNRVTVTTTGPATVSLTYGSVDDAEPAVLDETPAEPVEPAEPVDDAPVVEPVADEAPGPVAEPAAEPVAEDDAVADEPVTDPVALPDEPAPEVPAEPQATQPEPPADDAPSDAAGTESITDEWAHLVAHLTTDPPTPSIEDELARLREACK